MPSSFLRPAVLAVLFGWNLAVTLAWLGERPAQADAPACGALLDEIAQLREALRARGEMVAFLAARLHGVALGNIREAEQALSGTGLEVETLIRRGREGGPFVPAPDETPPDGLHDDVERWDQLNRALQVLPLAAPLARFEVSSGFGVRRDPINRRRALHAGMDLLAPLRSPVLATAPGIVVFAGRNGGYGRMVEIDHGMGVRTRYGHLASIHVKAGQSVALGQRVGLLGGSGRSTGPHLHYEVLVDGRARNPRPFLAAGERLQR